MSSVAQSRVMESKGATPSAPVVCTVNFPWEPVFDLAMRGQDLNPLHRGCPEKAARNCSSSCVTPPRKNALEVRTIPQELNERRS